MENDGTNSETEKKSPPPRGWVKHDRVERRMDQVPSDTDDD